MNNWELCPLCNGSGMKKQPCFMTNLNIGVPKKTLEEMMKDFIENGSIIWQPIEDNYCEVCNGKRIINSFTGLPPKKETV